MNNQLCFNVVMCDVTIYFWFKFVYGKGLHWHAGTVHVISKHLDIAKKLFSDDEMRW